MTPPRRSGPPSLPGSLRVGVVGATGLVGEVLLSVLAERRFPVRELVPLASQRSAGASVAFGGREWAVEEAHPDAFESCDVVFFAATGELSRGLAPEARDRGALVVDKSSTWRLDPEVPLLVPEVNGPRENAAVPGARIVASPNCTTVGVVLALAPLHRAARITRAVVTTFQAASGVGRRGLEVLSREEAGSAGGGESHDDASPFGRRLARNVVPQCDSFSEDGTSGEETKLREESRKILAAPDLRLTATCTRVPVPVGHAGSIYLETERPLSVPEARRLLEAFPGVRVVDEPDLPTPARVAGRDEVLVGRVRSAHPDRAGATTSVDGLWLWFAVDNLRKGAATNAVQIAEAYLLP